MSWWDDLQMNGVRFFILSTYIFYIGAIIGVAFINPKWYRMLDNIMKLYVGLFLFIRFNPFRDDVKFTKLDREISFHAGAFILSMLLVNSAFASYIPDSIKNK
jgi:hypothetical protein